MADSDPQDLQNRIALLKGQIQRHKEAAPPTSTSTYRSIQSPYQNSHRSRHSYHPYTRHHSPYSPEQFRNKSLIINNNTDSSTKNSSTAIVIGSQTRSEDRIPDWISTRSRNAQIINPSAYHPIIARDRIIDPAAKIREQAQIIRQKLSSDELNTRHVSIDGIKYSVQAGGSKLVRVKGLSRWPGKENFIESALGFDDTLSTPKQVTVSGISFLRSKNGNLYRSSVVKTNWNDISTGKSLVLCKRFTNTGSCSHGPKCPYIHDTTKIAVCREFLKLGTCSQGQHCDLSHDLTYECVPACVHFVRGGCTKENCPYPHIRINPAAPVCRAFTTFGYCSKGVECKDKHVFECPDYAEGKCSNLKCRLPHVDRAGQLRQQQQLQQQIPENSASHHDIDAKPLIKGENQTPLDSGSSDIDSDNEVMMDVDGIGFAQEQDFLKF